MKYLVQVWTIGDQEFRNEYRYKFDLRNYSFMEAYKDVNTTILEVQNE